MAAAYLPSLQRPVTGIDVLELEVIIVACSAGWINQLLALNTARHWQSHPSAARFCRVDKCLAILIELVTTASVRPIGGIIRITFLLLLGHV